MIEQLLTPLNYEYMVKAILTCGLIGGVCAFLSCFVILKGWSLMGDALSHAIVPGVAIAWLVGLPFSIGAFIAGILAAGGMAFVRTNTRLREDAVIGVIFTTFFALGLLLISLNPSNLNLKTIVFGNILGIDRGDLIQVIVISVLALAVIACRWRDLLLYCFDENYAHSLGINVRILHITLLTLLSAVAVAALQTVGALLVVAMLVTPGATAYLLTDRFPKMLGIACALGVGCSMVGAYGSYYLNGSTGGCIVVLQTLLFLSALIFAPRHGLLAHRALRRSASFAVATS